VAAAAQGERADDGTAKRVAIGVGAVTDVPLRLDAAERQLTGTALDPAIVQDAVRAALADVETLADLHASADYRRRVGASLAARAVADALTHAQTGKQNAH
jgi:carbon-monoxide dehydrogenase medium subunit